MMKIKFSFILCLLASTLASSYGRNIYVSVSTGNDHNEGLSRQDAFKSIQYAASVCQPDDTILIAPGEYKSPTQFVMRLSRSGTKNNWIVFKNMEITRPILYVSNEAAISLNSVSYIALEGLEITIDPEFITKNSNIDQNNNLTSKGNGIQIERMREENYRSHHIRIKNNYIHDCPGNGMDIFSTDYLDILYNVIQSNGNYSMNSNCGIRIQFLSALDQAQEEHIHINYNMISEQRQLGPLSKINNSCEENYGASGIAIRNNRYDPIQALKPGYTLPIQISNNIIYLNGGQAIDIFETDAVSIINNTCYQNNQNNESSCGELQLQKSKNDKVMNNIFYTRIKMRGSTVANYENNIFKNNLYYNTKEFFKGEKDLNEDPMFTSVDHHRGIFDFDLRPKSPCINTGNKEFIGPYDYYGAKRASDGNVDIGALEYTGALPKPRDHEQARLDKRHMVVSWQQTYSAATGQIIILNSKGDIFSARLYNSLGILLEQQLRVNGAKRGIEFDVSGYPNGIYFVDAFSENDKFAARYYVKNTFTNLIRRN